VTKYVRITCVTDGSSDRCLGPMVNWFVETLGIQEFAYRLEFSHRGVGAGLGGKVAAALRLFPCDILLVHRDAEGEPATARLEEILESVAAAEVAAPLAVAIPIRMTEAWLFSSESAIREAAGNPSGTGPLQLPPRRRWENLADPKEDLFEVLRRATGLAGRRLAKFDVHRARWRVADLTSDYSGLTGIPSFDAFRQSFVAAVERLLSP
jgi:hypothetical protein